MKRLAALIASLLVAVGFAAAGSPTVEAKSKPPKPCHNHCPPPTTTSTSTSTTLPETTTTAPDGVTRPAVVPSDWQLGFDDEFSGTTLSDRWASSKDNRGTMNDVVTDPANVRVDGGNLYLRLSDEHTGALVNTNPADAAVDPFEFTVGYAEARIFFPGTASIIYNWPAWWTDGQVWPENGEHDIAEGLYRLTTNYHGGSPENPQDFHSGPIPGDWAGGFHTYGLLRGMTSATVFWDGVQVATYPTTDGADPHFLILNVGYRPEFGPLAIGAEMAVDWVRVWTPATPPPTSTTTSTITSTTSTTVAPTTTSAPPQQAGPPSISDVGPRFPLTTNDTQHLAPGRYERVNFTQYILPSCGDYIFIDSVLAGFDATNPCVNVIMDHARVNNGLYFESGSQDGWEIYWSLIDGQGRQALRPSGPGWILVVDSWLVSAHTECNPAIHTEVLQTLNAASGVYNRVAFSQQPIPCVAPEGYSYTPVTAIVTADGNSQFTDSIFGYWNQAYGGGAGRWGSGGGVYGIYAGDVSSYVRPTIYHPSPWYPPAPSGSRLVDPTYR